MFAHHEIRVGVGCAVTDRAGGVSTGPYEALNLATHVGDDLSAVDENRDRLRAGLDVDGLAFMQQEHAAEVAVVDAVPTVAPVADALVTRTPGLAVCVLVADCTPVLLWDRRARVVAAVHVGRRGLVAGVLAAATSVMGSLGARPDRIYAHVGPSICPEHYEVPEGMRDEVASVARDSAAVTRAGRPAIHIRNGLVAQLYDLGVRRLSASSACTAEQDRYFSYRRDGVTGRFAGCAWLS